MSGPGHNKSNDSGGVCSKENDSSVEQDQLMKDWAKKHESDDYSFVTNNCFNFVYGAINGGK